MSILDDELEERYPQNMGGGNDPILITRHELMDMQRAAYRAGAHRKRTPTELHEAGLDPATWAETVSIMDATLNAR